LKRLGQIGLARIGVAECASGLAQATFERFARSLDRSKLRLQI